VDYQTNLMRSFWEYAENEFITGRIKPVIDRVFDFDQIRLAHEYMEANLNAGKVLLKIA
jgi:NADPH:quinone reductase-like Zn-dependent oxidoreductase